MTSVDEILYAPIQPAEEPSPEAPIIEGLETVSLEELVDQSAAYYHNCQNRFAMAQSVQGLGSLANLNAQLQNLNHLQQTQAQNLQGLGSLKQNLQGLALQGVVLPRQVKMPQGWQNPTTFEQSIREIEALIS